jgi:Haem-binding domain
MKLHPVLWGRLVGVGFIALLVIQLVPYGRDHLNPPTTSEPIWDSPSTRALAKRACFDCHSNETKWPAYSHIAPASWLVQHDVKEGRAVLNFSEWRRPQKEATEAAEEVTEGAMPPAVYRLLHAHARLSNADRDRLARGLAKTLGVAQEHAAGGR